MVNEGNLKSFLSQFPHSRGVYRTPLKDNFQVADNAEEGTLAATMTFKSPSRSLCENLFLKCSILRGCFLTWCITDYVGRGVGGGEQGGPGWGPGAGEGGRRGAVVF